MLYHFSDRDGISVFKPRAPLRHPDSEPLVYAIDEWHSALYLFPRDCPRIAIWPVDESSEEDREAYLGWTRSRILAFIEEGQEPDWRTRELYRYEFDPKDGFFDTGCIGVWTSRDDVVPLGMKRLADLPGECARADVEVVLVKSLVETAQRFFDFAREEFTTSLHVSMIRTSAIPDWPSPVTKPRFDRQSLQKTEETILTLIELESGLREIHGDPSVSPVAKDEWDRPQP